MPKGIYKRKIKPVFPSRKGKKYIEIYGDRWKEEIEKRMSGFRIYAKFRKKNAKRLYGHCSKKDIEWRKSIWIRDDYTCQKCGIKGGCGKAVILNAHHIKSYSKYPECRYDMNNGITLCIDCHKLTDNYGGKCLKK